MMKKVILIFLLVLVMTFCGCNGEKSENLEMGWECQTFLNYNFPSVAYTNEGFYFITAGKIAFYDYASSKSVYLCTRANCAHSDNTCDAAIPFLTEIFYCKDKIYAVGAKAQEDGFQDVIYEMDKDGTNRRVVVIINAQTEMERSWYPGTVHHGVYYYSEAVEENKMSFFAADIFSGKKECLDEMIKGINPVMVYGKNDYIYYVAKDEEKDEKSLFRYSTIERKSEKIKDNVKNYTFVEDDIYILSEGNVYSLNSGKCLYELERKNAIINYDGQQLLAYEFSTEEQGEEKGQTEIFELDGKRVAVVSDDEGEYSSWQCIFGQGDRLLYSTVCVNQEGLLENHILSWDKNQIGQENYIFKDMAPEYNNK